MTLNFASGSFSLHWNRETHENEELMELNKPEQKEQAQDVFSPDGLAASFFSLLPPSLPSSKRLGMS